MRWNKMFSVRFGGSKRTEERFVLDSVCSCNV